MKVLQENNTILAKKDLNFEEKLFEFIYKASKRSPIPVILIYFLFAAMLYKYVDKSVCVFWFAIASMLFLLRSYVVRKLYISDNFNSYQKLKYTQFCSLLIGAAHVSILVFFSYFQVYERAIISMILVSVCIGSIFTSAGYRPILYPVVFLVLIPLSICWAITPAETEVWIQYYIAGVILMLLVMLLSSARDTFQQFSDSFQMRLEQVSLNIKLQKALESEETANKAKTRFLAAASHDLRQPLHTLSLFSAALSMQKMDKRSKEIADNIEKALEVLSSQLDSLLDISKLDAGVVEIKKECMSLSEMLTRLHGEYKNISDGKGLGFTLNQPEDALIETDAIQFERLIRNVLSNSFKYTDKGEIVIEVEEEEERCLLKIRDTGHGIPEDEKVKIFEEFYQLENPSRNRNKGLGLGLSIVKRISNLLGIKYKLYSVLNEGTTVVFTLDKSKQIPQLQPELSKSTTNQIFENLTVLIVDDDEEIRNAMSVLLENIGCNVLLAFNTKSAIDHLKSCKPDLMLVDFRLHDNDTGVKTIKEARKIHSEIPAIIITGDIEQDRLLSIKGSNLPMLHKPVTLNDLRNLIAEVLEK